MIELLISTAILSVGLLALAGFISKMDLTTNESRYASTAALLCSEKLEQLSGYAPGAAEVKITANHKAGSLTKDDSQTVTANGESVLVSYYDTVTISATNGSITETTVDANGTAEHIVQKPDGIDPKPKDTELSANERGVAFKRRWLIEDNVPGLPTQVRRVTVQVEYPAGGKMAKFQMSMVRNAEPE